MFPSTKSTQMWLFSTFAHIDQLWTLLDDEFGNNTYKRKNKEFVKNVYENWNYLAFFIRSFDQIRTLDWTDKEERTIEIWNNYNHCHITAHQKFKWESESIIEMYYFIITRLNIISSRPLQIIQLDILSITSRPNAPIARKSICQSSFQRWHPAEREGMRESIKDSAAVCWPARTIKETSRGSSEPLAMDFVC